MKPHRVALWLLAAAAVGSAPGGGLRAQDAGGDGGGLEIDIGLDDTSDVKVQTVNEEKRAFESAQQKMNVSDWDGAAVEFNAILQNKKAKKYHPQSEYLLAKALYRLGFYHSALERFAGILKKGKDHKYFKTSKEWLFFISRKTADQGVVAEEIARYAADDLPEKYADEFHYILSRLYFRKAADEGEEREAPPPTQEEELEFDTQDLGSGGDAAGSAGDDDSFDFDLDALEDQPKKKKAKRGAKKKKKRGKRGRAPVVEEEEPAPAPPPPPEPEPEPEAVPEAAPAPAPEPAAADSGADALEFQLEETSKAATDAPLAPEPAPEPVVEAPPSNALVADTREALEKCVEHAAQVSSASALYLKSVYLKGVCQYELGQFEEAVATFKDVVRQTKTGRWANHPLREEAFFSLARTHYAFKQFRAAIFYYSRISRDSPGWLDALFESSWAYFRLADYEKALGNLVTLHAPFFVDEYFPESHILKAVTYYENCRYPEALAILGEFEGQYGPLRDELDRLTKDAKTPEDYFELLRKLESTRNASPLTVRLVTLAKTDRNLSLLTQSARELEGEDKRINAAKGALAGTALQKELAAAVTKRRAELTQEAGAVARAKLQAERDELKGLSSQLLRIKFEVTKREKEGLEAELRGEKQSVELGGYRYTTAVPDDYEYWPFEGEYWRDELGTYEYTLAKGCRQ